MQIYVRILALVRLSGWEEIKMKCSEEVNEMSGLGEAEGGRLNCKISLIGSILSVKNERSCKNGGQKCPMFGPSHVCAPTVRSHFCFIQCVPKK